MFLQCIETIDRKKSIERHKFITDSEDCGNKALTLELEYYINYLVKEPLSLIFITIVVNNYKSFEIGSLRGDCNINDYSQL